MEPQYRFCTSSDGTRISCSTLGGGVLPPAIVCDSWASVQESAWDNPAAFAFDGGMARDRCVVRFDRRGVGASERDAEDLSMDAHIADVQAVAENLELKQFDLQGAGEGAPVAIAYAAQYPDRVRHLILWSPYARGADVYDPGRMHGLAELMRSDWGLARRTFAGMAFPNGPVERQRQFGAMLRDAISPEMAARYIEFQTNVDVTALVPRVQASTLVLQRRMDGAGAARAARSVAALIPGARRAMTRGDGTLKDWEEQLDLVRDYLGERTIEPEAAPRAPDPSDATLAPRPLPAKAFASGRYTVRRVLGEGGQKVVYLVHDEALDRDCALSMVKAELLEADDLERLRREAQAMARLGAHSNIVTVHDIGDEDGKPYLVCEYVPAGELRRHLRDAAAPLALERALAIAADIARALAVAHGRGVVHRDVKPANVWLCDDGSAKLGDFGLAFSLDRTRMTLPGSVMGTATYMAPEQARGEPTDARTDLYALGVMLYEMVCGRPPFSGDDPLSVISQHATVAPAAPVLHVAGLTPALNDLILRLLAKSPDQRPASAAVVLGELRVIAESLRTPDAPPEPEALEPDQPPASPGFVGRAPELKQLAAALDRTVGGTGSLVMVVGEPGIGKTRLLEQFAAHARAAGAHVLNGHCYDGDWAPPFSPFVEAIKEHAAATSPQRLRAHLAVDAGVLTRIVPALHERLPDLEEPPALQAEGERYRLLDAVSDTVGRIADARPLVIVLDDLHWADKGTIAMLRHVVHGAAAKPVLLLGAYRDVELDRQHPLAAALADLRRETAFERIPLKGLDADEVGELLDVIAEQDVPRPLVDAIATETNGNPFFIKEVLLHLIEERKIFQEDGRWTSKLSIADMGIPEGVREAIGRRLSRVSDTCGRLLTIASALTAGFSWDVIAAVADADEAAFLDALDEALAAQLIVEGERGRYDFTHALIRHTLYEELSTPRSVLLHRQIGEALERLYADDVEPHLAELAHHFYEAAPGGDLAKAIQYLRRAGDCSVRQLAYDEAVAHFERAAEFEADDLGRCELLLALADALARAGMGTRADATFERAGDIALRLSSSELLVRSALGAEPLGLQAGVSVRLVEAALAALPLGDTVARARCLAHLAPAFGREERGGELSSQAVEMARRLGDRETLAHALTSVYHHLVEAYPLDVRRRLDIASEVLQIATEIGDKELALASGHCDRLQDFIHLGDMAAAEPDIEAHARLSLELRQGGQQAHTLGLYTMRSTIAGRFAEAEALAAEALDLGRRIEHPQAEGVYFLQMLVLRREQGRLSDLPERPAGPGEASPNPLLLAARALLHAEQDEPDACRRAVEVLFPDGAEGPPRGAGAIVLALLAEVCAWLADRTRAAVMYELLVPYADRAITSDGAFIVLGSGSRALGLLATTMRRYDDADGHFEDALAMNQRMGARTCVARTQLDCARMLIQRDGAGDRERARELLDAALEAAREMGMAKVVADCEALLAAAT